MNWQRKFFICRFELAHQQVLRIKEIVNNPIYSTGVGLLQFGMQEQTRHGFKEAVNQDGSSILDKIKNFFQAGV